MQFTKLRFKNFLSFGNKFTEIDLNTNKATLITGENGSGKTATLEAFYFAMTGKPFRKIKKQELINTTNKKELLIELEFTHENNQYKIIRGIKPDIFEIYKNNQLIEQDAATKDYQQILENILGLDSKTLGQSIFISSKNYTPFLKLQASEKRNFVENVLDLKVFSSVLEQIKIKRSIHKEKHQELEYNLKSVQTNLQLAIESNEKFNKNKTEQVKELNEKITAEEQAVEDDEIEIKKINKWLTNSQLEEKRLELTNKESSLNEELQTTINKLKQDAKTELDELYNQESKISFDLNNKKETSNQEKLVKERFNSDIKKIESDSEQHLKHLLSQLKSSCENQINKIESEQRELKKKIETNNKRVEFFENNSVCPTCEQEISTSNDVISSIISELKESNEQYKKEIKTLDDSKVEKNKNLDKLIKTETKRIEKEKEQDIAEKNKQIYQIAKTLEELDKSIESFQKDLIFVSEKIKSHNDSLNNKIEQEKEKHKNLLLEIQEKISNIDKDINLANKTINQRTITINSCKRLIKSWQDQIDKLNAEKADLVDTKPIELNIVKIQKEIQESEYEKETIDMLIKMLGDSGLKSYIVKKYIPTLNELVNKYLEMFGATYRLSFDESFDINIHARGYEKLQYGSFSSGEEQRVDIALLFSFIELGKLKNSINCNVLLLDELADTSLDSVGLDGLFMMFEDMKRRNQTIFTISHRPELKERFDKSFVVKKVNNFSQLEEV